jgi:peptide deformylase
MAIRNLTNWNDPIFRKTSRAVEKFDERLWTSLLDDMRETLEKVNGYGCAAVHVGILKRVVVVNDDNGVIELINPIIVETSEETQEVLEGSIAPGAPRGYVIRPESVTVKGFDRNGNPIEVQGDGFLSSTLCHEIDHLAGVLFMDKANKIEN